MDSLLYNFDKNQAKQDNQARQDKTLCQSIVAFITDSLRQMPAQARIPSSRALAQSWGVSRGTVQQALDILIAEGLLYSRQGAGVFIAAEAKSEASPQALATDFIINAHAISPADIDKEQKCKFDFRPCQPDISQFPMNEWRRAVAKASLVTPSTHYESPRGSLELREMICQYLRRARGLTACTDEIMITNGAIHAMYLVGARYLKAGDKVVVEDPGYPLARQAFEAAGAQMVPCPVDRDGLVIDAIPDDPAIKVVYLTPSHQFPTGHRLSLARRQALIAWAERKQVIIIEDDYDGEFRFDVPPLRPMAAMPNRCVVYCGSFSKTLFPSLRLGFVIAPQPFIADLANFRARQDYTGHGLAQHALAHFMASGGFEKHILRMRRFYRQKRVELGKMIKENFTKAKMTGLHSGINAVIELDKAFPAPRISAEAAKHGLLLPPIERYLLPENKPRKAIQQNALILGYAHPSLRDLEKGVKLLSTLL